MQPANWVHLLGGSVVQKFIYTYTKNSKILPGKILQRFSDKGISKVEGYNSFKYLREANDSVYVSRENAMDTRIPFKKIFEGIEAFKTKSELYDEGPSALRDYNITHITSPNLVNVAFTLPYIRGYPLSAKFIPLV